MEAALYFMDHICIHSLVHRGRLSNCSEKSHVAEYDHPKPSFSFLADDFVVWFAPSNALHAVANLVSPWYMGPGGYSFSGQLCQLNFSVWVHVANKDQGAGLKVFKENSWLEKTLLWTSEGLSLQR